MWPTLLEVWLRAQGSHGPDEALPSLSDSDIEEHVSFFQLLDQWDRQQASN